MKLLRRCGAVAVLLAVLAWPARGAEDPEIRIPTCRTAPKIDGKFSPEEWKGAAAAGMLEGWPGRNVQEGQAVFHVCRDADNLYVAMVSIDSNTNGVVAKCVMHDNRSICGDDIVELMIAPGAGEDLKRFDFPTFYIVANSIGTVWDAKFIVLANEDHNSWESGVELANEVDGTYWCCEMRIPFANISPKPPADGTVWRMNFVRTFHDYKYAAWRMGALNDARCGGNATFDGAAAALRLLSVDLLLGGRLGIDFEAVNPTDREQKVTVAVSARGRPNQSAPETAVGADEKTVVLPPGRAQEFRLGKGQALAALNTIVLEAKDAQGRRLMAMERSVAIPAVRMTRMRAPKVSLVHVFPRFLPSFERLAVLVDYTAWAKKTGYSGPPPTAEVKVWKKGAEAGTPVLEGALNDFAACRGTWRSSTKDLPEGDYTVRVAVRSRQGELLADHDDWFEKRIFDWMKHPRGTGDAVPSLYEPLTVKGQEIGMWGRRYRMDSTGLPASVLSQGREILSGRAEFVAEAGGKRIDVAPVRPFAVGSAKPAKVEGASALSAGDLRMSLACAAEYDGFVLYRLTYGPRGESAAVDRLRVRVPIRAERAKFYSASGDIMGVSVQGEVLPDRQGRVYSSMTDTRSVVCSPTFATLFWVADRDVSFCYAADSDKGWIVRDDAPAVEAVREGETVVLWLNLVDRPSVLTKERTLEFAFQAGPTKALPEGWRGLQDGGDPDDAPATVVQMGVGGLRGGTHMMHPGTTDEEHRKSRELVEAALKGDERASAVGYHFIGRLPKGMPECRVFRGEWGIDKGTWEAAQSPEKGQWDRRVFGENKDLHIIMSAALVQSHVDFITYAYDECLKHTPITGFYDDTGYPKPVFDEELGLGYVREDGRQVWSSGLWMYRERWKRAAYVNFQNKRPNYLRDSQHCHAHFMPAYNFIGLWAPCEYGYYNPFADRDNVDFYRSMERYAAYNPARQFGQPAMVGMSAGARADNGKVFAQDTRGMMMLTLLHDQDVGSFGSRDARVVRRLRRARNVFRPWEKGTEFTGYWESGEWVKAGPAGAAVSLYRRPGDGVLFMVGNPGDGAVTATVEPDWKKLGLDPGKIAAVDAETGEAVKLTAGASKRGFAVAVGRHDVRLVAAGPAGRYAVEPVVLGAALPKPKEVLADLSDPLTGDELGKAWELGMHKGNAGAWMIDGRLCVQGHSYGYALVRRPLGVDNVSVQCMVMQGGGYNTWGGSMFVYWANGEYVQASPCASSGKFLYTVSGAGKKDGGAISLTPVRGWSPYAANWVKVVLKPATVECWSSADGKGWVKDWEAKRGPKLAGAPQYVMLGRGGAGSEPLLQNVWAQHFTETGRTTQSFFSDLIVGRE